MKKEAFILTMHKWENKCSYDFARVKIKAFDRGTICSACLVSLALDHLSKENLIPLFF